MNEIDESKYGNWRDEEKSLKEVIEEFPDFSKFAILKTDLQRRGVVYSDAALLLFDKKIHSAAPSCIFSDSNGIVPTGLLLRDGTSVVLHETGENRKHRAPYLVDREGDHLIVTDQGEKVDEVFYWERADFFDKFTKSGKPIWSLVSTRPQRLDITGSWYCHFWDTPGCGCKYCPIGAQGGEKKKNGEEVLSDIEDIKEVVAEALKQKGRFTNIMITTGSILSGKELLDDEVDYNIRLINALSDLFVDGKYPLQLIGTAYSRKQLERLHNETELPAYTADIEVLNEDVFNKLCPGKAKFVGYQEWKNRLKAAVDIFGRGHVDTGLVTGTELAEGIGFATEDEAYQKVSEEAEELAEAGITCAATIWQPSKGSILKDAKNPSLEYCVKISKKFEDLRRKYNIPVDFDDYRRCGNHPNTDLARV